MKKIMLTALLIIVGVEVKAGKVVGNGGDAVVCYTDATRSTIASVKMFDYWEQEQVLHYGPIDLGASQLSVQEKIEVATNHISKFDPNLAQYIKKTALNLADNIQSYLVTDYILPDIVDSNPQIIPSQPNCFIEQFAIQFKDVLTGQRRFYISELFYNHVNTSNDEKAGLLLHEAIYRYAILKNNATDSDGVRLFNYTIASKKIESIRPENLSEYLDILKNAKIYKEECIQSGEFYIKPDLYTTSGKTCFNQVAIYGNVKISAPANVDLFRMGATYQRLSLDNPKDPTFHITIIDPNGLQTYLTAPYVVIFASAGQKINIQNATPLISSPYPTMHGPLNKSYECDSFWIDTHTSELQECSLRDKTQPFYLFSKTATNNEWNLSGDTKWNSLKNGNKLMVLGSLKNLLIEPSIDMYSTLPARRTRVDKQLNLISASVQRNPELQSPVTFSGQELHMTDFEVNFKNGKYVLTFTSATKIFNSPTVRNLRVIDSSNKYSNGSIFCALNGLSQGITNMFHSEYINVKSEQFFDLGTHSIVYKTDEDVTVIDSIQCQPTKIETDDY